MAILSGAKPWQVAIVGIGFLVLAGMIVYQVTFSQKVDIAPDIVLVDVETGDLFIADKPSGRSLYFPLKNPDSKKDTLFPAVKTDGKWFVVDRYMPRVADVYKSKAPAGVADMKTGLVSTKGDSPKRVSLF